MKVKTLVLSGLAMAGSVFALPASAAVDVPSFITADSVGDIGTAITSVIGIAGTVAFTVLGVSLAARQGIGIIKGFLSRAT
ncbi:hypothetical protein AOY57_13345 [Escherichia coli]|uniref:hypothetical protein n=1 Tax=Escherichia coli TaxID=562 RepID=UPI0019193F19|nr:hypothetical protein [Escherichia coli]UMT23126.1 hypothetical protein AOY57_13305 [Escherichia coli]UMT23132.1 hypothetical protein AOY57_13345 [Escherichia coli]CAD6175504.1 Uncharacterised protein [Escherichia coli]